MNCELMMKDKDMLYEKLLGGALINICISADRLMSTDALRDRVNYTELLECAICSGLFRVMPKASFDARMGASKFLNHTFAQAPASTKDAAERADKQAAYVGREFMEFINSELSIDNNGWFDTMT